MPFRGLKQRVFAAGIAATCSWSGLLFSQTQTALLPAFEVASIRRSAQDTSHPQGFRIPSAVIRGISGNRLTERYTTFAELIMQAYDVKEYQISGSPDWASWKGDQFDIVAKAEGNGTPSVSQIRQMLQTLLVERFHLKLHRVFKELPVYELVVGKNGPKLREVDGSTSPAAYKGQGLKMWRSSMDILIRMVSTRLDRPLIDKTGLTGKTYEFQFDQIALARCDGQGEETSACVSDEVQKQLGLKMEARKGSVDVLMIDHVERPTAN
jgi:uncharacterized protein (TIGR03435 family)